MYPEDNIFDLYKRLDKRTPFRVRRLHVVPPDKTVDDFRNENGKVFVVEDVKLRGKYGETSGYCMIKGVRDDNYVKSIYPDSAPDFIPCDGCGGWILIDQKDLDYIANRPKESPDFVLKFGKYKGKSLKEVAACDISYLKWLYEHEVVNLNPSDYNL